jgi:hypothetical protein
MMHLRFNRQPRRLCVRPFGALLFVSGSGGDDEKRVRSYDRVCWLRHKIVKLGDGGGPEGVYIEEAETHLRVLCCRVISKSSNVSVKSVGPAVAILAASLSVLRGKLPSWHFRYSLAISTSVCLLFGSTRLPLLLPQADVTHGQGQWKKFPSLFFFFSSMFLELNSDIFIEPIVDFMHRTQHLTKPGLEERLWGAAPNQDTKK